MIVEDLQPLSVVENKGFRREILTHFYSFISIVFMNKQPLKWNKSSVEDPSFQDFESEEQNISMELESSLGDVPLQDTQNEEHSICPMELESSLEDPPLLQDFESEEQATPPVLVSFQLFAEGTKRGHIKLIDSLGYTYNIKLRRPNVTYWQCTVRPKVNQCKATVMQRNETFVNSNVSHIHPPSTDSASTTKITSQVKKMAVQDLFKSVSVIVDEVSMLKIIAYIVHRNNKNSQNILYRLAINANISFHLGSTTRAR